jgi:hypothetical protein
LGLLRRRPDSVYGEVGCSERKKKYAWIEVNNFQVRAEEKISKKCGEGKYKGHKG